MVHVRTLYSCRIKTVSAETNSKHKHNKKPRKPRLSFKKNYTKMVFTMYMLLHEQKVGNNSLTLLNL